MKLTRPRGRRALTCDLCAIFRLFSGQDDIILRDERWWKQQNFGEKGINCEDVKNRPICKGSTNTETQWTGVELEKYRIGQKSSPKFQHRCRILKNAAAVGQTAKRPIRFDTVHPRGSFWCKIQLIKSFWCPFGFVHTNSCQDHCSHFMIIRWMYRNNLLSTNLLLASPFLLQLWPSRTLTSQSLPSGGHCQERKREKKSAPAVFVSRVWPAVRWRGDTVRAQKWRVRPSHNPLPFEASCRGDKPPYLKLTWDCWFYAEFAVLWLLFEDARRRD